MPPSTRPSCSTAPRRRWLRGAGLLAAATIAGLPWAAVHASDDGTRLAQAMHDRPAPRDATVVARMELTDRSGSKRQRELVTYRLERGKGEFLTLARFLEPDDIAGTGLLSIDRADGSSEQWLYLPSLERVRRVASDRKGGRFVGSDLYFEDLQTRRPADDRHTIVGRESVDGVACDVLESVPVEASNSVYKRRLSWIDPQTLLALRVDFFEKDAQTPSKRWNALTRRKVQGFWVVTDSRTQDLASGHQTRMVSQTLLFDRKLPAKLFTSQSLADEEIESGYRP